MDSYLYSLLLCLGGATLVAEVTNQLSAPKSQTDEYPDVDPINSSFADALESLSSTGDSLLSV